jgi:hypothetical protein
MLLASPASAASDWVSDVLGPYVGPVFNDGALETMQTEFTLDPSGNLIGHYHVEDTPPFDGELSNFHDEGDHTALFTWTDRYGQGVVRVHFLPDEGRFVGDWGNTAPVTGQIFHGHRFHSQVTS